MTWRRARNSALIAVNGSLATACAGFMVFEVLEAAATGGSALPLLRLAAFCVGACAWGTWAFART